MHKYHDPCKPFQNWFQRTPEGLALFVVFYCMACRYKKCTGCNLHMQMSSEHIGYRFLMAQIDYLLKIPAVASQLDHFKKLIVSNNGSVLDEKTFSSTALIYLVAMANMHMPSLRTFCIESRPEHVDDCELEFIARALKEGDTETKLEIAVGFEAFDDELRNNLFKKGITRQTFEQFLLRLSKYQHMSVKTYFMLKPTVGLSDEKAIADIHGAIKYLGGLVKRYGVPINLHLNPTFVAKGTELEKQFREGEYQPPQLVDVARAALCAKDEPISVFLGLYDEGLAVEGGSFVREGDESILEQLDEFNVSQDYEILEEIVGRSM